MIDYFLHLKYFYANKLGIHASMDIFSWRLHRFEPKVVYSGLGLDRGSISNGTTSNHFKTVSSKIWTFVSGFQKSLATEKTICPDFKWAGFLIYDLFQNLDDLQTHLFLEIQNASKFQIPTLSTWLSEKDVLSVYLFTLLVPTFLST